MAQRKAIAALLFALTGALAIRSEVALGFPDFARHDYQRCEACHVSPSGGGALNAYGRMTSASLSTWGSETLARPFYGIDVPQWLAVGGDQRALRGAFPRGPGVTAYKTIPMQYDLELAASPVPYFTVAATWGVYGDDFEEESRRHYALLRLGETAAVRVGRFMPVYSIMGPDHSSYPRKALGFDQGTEPVAAELSLRGELGDFFATAIYGQDATFTADRARGYDTDSAGETGAALRAQAYVGKAQIVGVSYLRLGDYEETRDVVGAHGILSASTWSWSLLQADYHVQEREWVTQATTGVEAFKGFSVLLSAESQRTKYRNSLSLQWLPLPHLELLATYYRETRADTDVDSWTLLLHHYL